MQQGNVFTSICDSVHRGMSARHPLGRQTPPPPADGYCSRWYTSYWNASCFLKNIGPLFSQLFFSIVSMVTGWIVDRMGSLSIMGWITDRYFWVKKRAEFRYVWTLLYLQPYWRIFLFQLLSRKETEIKKTHESQNRTFFWVHQFLAKSLSPLGLDVSITKTMRVELRSHCLCSTSILMRICLRLGFVRSVRLSPVWRGIHGYDLIVACWWWCVLSRCI